MTDERETIHDICTDLRDAGAGWHSAAFLNGLADRIEAAHEREMATTTPAAIANLANFLGTSGYDTLGNERHKAVCELRNIHTDAGGFVKELAAAIGVEWKAPRVKQTISEIRDRLIHLLGGDAQVDLANLGKPYHEGGAVLDAGVIRECKKPTPETYTGLTLRFPNPAETQDDGDASVTSDARSDEDTREDVERDALVLLDNLRAYGSKYASDAECEMRALLDRQAAITEREVECDMIKAGHAVVEIERERIAELRATIDRQRDVIDRFRDAYNAVRGLFDDHSGAGRMA
jgi:hypothetical protein